MNVSLYPCTCSSIHLHIYENIDFLLDYNLKSKLFSAVYNL